MHDTLNSDSREPFLFSYDRLLESGLTTKDFIAPTSLDFRNGRYFRMGGSIGAVSYLQILAPELTDKLLAQFLDIDSDLVLTLHIHSLDQTKAIKNVKSKITDLDRMKMDEQKKAVRSGYDMDILPSDLQTFGTEAKKLLEDAALVHALHGQVVKIAANSTDYINPLDINMNYSEDDSPLHLKSEFILSLFELIMGKNGIEGEERSIIDQAIRAVYQPYLEDPRQENMPILEDLYDYLIAYDHPKAKRIATTLDIYVHGSLNVFNHQTNIDLDNRLVCFDIKDLGKQLKKLGMLIIQDQVWGRVTENRYSHKHTWFYCDEFHRTRRSAC